jgi:hypothetical protein
MIMDTMASKRQVETRWFTLIDSVCCGWVFDLTIICNFSNNDCIQGCVDATKCHNPLATTQNPEETTTVVDTELHPDSRELRAHQTLMRHANRNGLLLTSPKHVSSHLSFEAKSGPSCTLML